MQILDDVRKLTPERQGPIVVLATLLIHEPGGRPPHL